LQAGKTAYVELAGAGLGSYRLRNVTEAGPKEEKPIRR
jgi:hypothetical protein